MVGAGEGEEDVIEVRRLHREALDTDAATLDPTEHGHHRLRGAVGGHLEREAVVVRDGAGEQRLGSGKSLAVRELKGDSPAGDASLQLRWRALGDHPTAIENRDALGEPVCVVSRMLTPRAASPSTISHMVRRLSGSRPAVGSSWKMISGSPSSVMARSRRRRMPPE